MRADVLVDTLKDTAREEELRGVSLQSPFNKEASQESLKKDRKEGNLLDLSAVGPVGSLRPFNKEEDSLLVFVSPNDPARQLRRNARQLTLAHHAGQAPHPVGMWNESIRMSPPLKT